MGSDDPDLDDDDAPDPLDGVLDPDEPFECWCGATGPYPELCDAAVYSSGPCGGLGVLHCECGGDLCVCHNHGEVECPGCEDCEPDDDYGYDPDHGGEG